MERFLLKLILGIAVMSIYLPVFSQVKLFDSGITKFYDDGTRITYFKMADFPNSAEMRDFVTKIVLENPDISRAVIYTNGETFMYESLQRIEPDMVVDAVNDALAEYRVQVGDFPAKDPQSTSRPKSNVIVTPHVTNSDLKSHPAVGVNQKSEAIDGNSVSKNGERQVGATPVEEVRTAAPMEGNGANAKEIGNTSSAKNNGNIKNR